MRALAIIATALFALAAAAGCAKNQRTPEPQDNNTSKSSDKNPASPTPDTRAGGDRKPTVESTSMPAGFDKAFAAFREHAAKTLGVPVDGMQGGPSYERAGDEFKESVGQVWGFRMFHKDEPAKGVQGWATRDGEVVTPQQNLGLLFAAAGAFADATPKLTAAELAERIAWALGMEYKVYVKPSFGAPAPEMTMKAGSGELVFFLEFIAAGPGGAGGGPETYYKAVVTLSGEDKGDGDGEATLQMTPVAL